MAVVVFLWLSVDRRDVGGRLVAGSVGSSSLFAMTYEVLEILNRAHLSSCSEGVNLRQY